MQLNFFEETLVNGSTTLDDLLRITGHNDTIRYRDLLVYAIEQIE